MSLTGILPVIPTPFHAGRFDAPSFERLLEHMGNDVDGFVLLGSTGAVPSLPVAQRQEIAARALALTPDRLTVVVGVSHTAVQDTVGELGRIEVLEFARPRDHVLRGDRGLAWQEAGLTVFAGDDPIAFRYLAAGVDGAMMIAPAVMPESFRRCSEQVRKDAIQDAFSIRR